MASVQIEHLTKTYSSNSKVETLALDDLSLTINKGEFFALLGPSGCGKSTLLHIIGGLSSASGTILINGEPVKGPGLNRGIVFQEYALFPWKTVLENVAFGLKMKGVPKKERDLKAREYLALVGLSGFEERYPDQLSGGMKQRTAIARALAFDPEVLLMDEPFAALDAQTREILQEELLRIWEKTGKTVIFVTHSIEEAVYLAQRVAVITARPGRIKEIVEIPLPEHRTAEEDIRSSAVFTEVRHRLWKLLSEEVVNSGALNGYGRPQTVTREVGEKAPLRLAARERTGEA
ncbi:ABC transporter ATP-binding protein [Geomesophilobacter sediminis]|uniref:ABC transporter ATP-binding protein n=1 Tax=Geomesophilobacter sediminis TaxID=2798584 RepID=A0A8J7JIS0_9BACT|nr:ABC transporter ATP-binding protein [Geomesophilobacter sediminis]MBJ6724335.1 ABC transporter ATP-binding protein [Geomesophilobacter sediminis]